MKTLLQSEGSILRHPDGSLLLIDWALWPASFLVNLPNVIDAGNDHGVDLSSIVVDKKDTPGVYEGTQEASNPNYSPITSRLAICRFSETGHIGWRFTWRCAIMEHFQCIRVIDLSASMALSPVGNYMLSYLAEGQLTANPPYSVSVLA